MLGQVSVQGQNSFLHVLSTSFLAGKEKVLTVGFPFLKKIPSSKRFVYIFNLPVCLESNHAQHL